MDFIEDKATVEALLDKCQWGTLSMSVDDQPYAVQLNYAYVHERIVFHCALKGRKLDSIAANPRVCFSIGAQEGAVKDHPQQEACHPDHWGVVVFGRAVVVSDPDRKALLANAFNRAYNPDAADINERRLHGCAVVEIEIDEMTARCEVNRKRKSYRYVSGEHNE